MSFKLYVLVGVLGVAACSNSEGHARRVLAEAEGNCGLKRGTLKFLSINEFDKPRIGEGSAKVIYVSSPDLGRFEACVDYVAQTNGYDRIRRLVTY